MVSKLKRTVAVSAAAVLGLSLAACGGGGSDSDNDKGGAAAAGEKGGTLTVLQHFPYESVDPQRIYYGVELAHFRRLLYRGLLAFPMDEDAEAGTTPVPDLATDTGTSTVTATVIAVTLGVVLGIVSGASGGWVDAIIGRITDLTLAFPQTLMLLALSAPALAFIIEVLNVPTGPPAQGFYVIVVLGLFGWTGVARVTRGQVLSLREREFVHAAELTGASRSRIYFKEILPNLWAPILVQLTLMLPAFVSAEAALSYLQVSIQPPTPTLGNVLFDALRYADTSFIYFFGPAILIATIVISFNLLGDGLRDALDPKGNR